MPLNRSAFRAGGGGGDPTSSDGNDDQEEQQEQEGDTTSEQPIDTSGELATVERRLQEELGRDVSAEEVRENVDEFNIDVSGDRRQTDRMDLDESPTAGRERDRSPAFQETVRTGETTTQRDVPGGETAGAFVAAGAPVAAAEPTIGGEAGLALGAGAIVGGAALAEGARRSGIDDDIRDRFPQFGGGETTEQDAPTGRGELPVSAPIQDAPEVAPGDSVQDVPELAPADSQQGVPELVPESPTQDFSEIDPGPPRQGVSEVSPEISTAPVSVGRERSRVEESRERLTGDDLLDPEEISNAPEDRLTQIGEELQRRQERAREGQVFDPTAPFGVRDRVRTDTEPAQEDLSGFDMGQQFGQRTDTDTLTSPATIPPVMPIAGQDTKQEMEQVNQPAPTADPTLLEFESVFPTPAATSTTSSPGRSKPRERPPLDFGGDPDDDDEEQFGFVVGRDIAPIPSLFESQFGDR